MAGNTITEAFPLAMFLSLKPTVSAYYLILLVEVVTILFLCLILISRLVSLSAKSSSILHELPGPKGL